MSSEDVVSNAPQGSVVSTSATSLDQLEFSQIDVRLLVRRLRAHWLLISVCTLLGVAIAIGIDLLPRHYTAVSRIQVRPGSSSQYKVDKSDLLSIGDDSTKLETEVLILQSDSLLLDTAKKLNLENDKDFMGRRSFTDGIDPPKAEEQLLVALHKNIVATRIPRSEIIQISCVSTSPKLSANVVNTLVAEYIQELFVSRFASTQRVTKWLSGQLEDLKQQVESDQERLVELQSRLGIVGLDQNHDIVVSELEDLTKAADEARIQRIIAEARYRILSSGDLNLLEGGQDVLERNSPNSSQLALLNNLRQQKAQVEAKYAGLSAQYGPRYPEVQQAAAELATLNHEIQAEQARVLNQAQQAFSAASANEKNTVATLEEKKSVAFQKQNDMVQYQILLHDYESDRSLYEGLMQRLRQAGIVAGLDSSEVDVVDMARVPGKSSDVGRIATLLLGLVFGLAVGLGSAFVIVQFDQRLHDLSAIESLVGLPVVTVVPDLGRTDLGRTDKQAIGALFQVWRMFIDEPRSPFTEAMWTLRTSLMLSRATKPPKVIIFTSCNPGEGKSTMSSGQACALAFRDARVVLIDGDMRHPNIMRRFSLPNLVGLSSILTGRATLADAIQKVPDVPNLSIITGGPIPPSPPLILASKAMSELITELSSEFDFIVIDCPPLLGLVDSSILAQFAEAVVLVSSYARFNKAQVIRARKTLLQVGRNITGLALNFADTQVLGDYGYGYGYGKVYGQYSGESAEGDGQRGGQA